VQRLGLNLAPVSAGKAADPRDANMAPDGSSSGKASKLALASTEDTETPWEEICVKERQDVFELGDKLMNAKK